MAKDLKAPKEKKPKKEAVGKDRRVNLTAKNLSAKIEVKLYQLDSALAAPFMRQDLFSFKVAFDGTTKKGQWRRFNKGHCPVISISADDILQTENETAQRMLEQFSVPQKTFREGKSHPAGKLFKDVTQTETGYNIDLDETFDKISSVV